MAKNQILIIFALFIFSFIFSLFVSPIFFILLILLLIYISWDIYDDQLSEKEKMQEKHDYPLLYDPNYHLIIE
ncbi:hypothetical protein [Candidatus Harpocratesius sp.]